MARSRRSVGLRVRITVVAAIAVGIVLTVGAAALVGLLRSRLDGAATTAATLRAQDIAALASGGSLPRRLALPGEESALVQVVDANGTVAASTDNIDGEPAIFTRRPDGTIPLELTTKVAALHEARAMRIVALNTDTRNGVLTVYSGESLRRSEETTGAIVAGLSFGVPALVAIVAALTWWAVGRTLRPVRAITRTMAEITATDLHRRVPAPGTRDELGVLATTVNETLERLDASVERQREFVADASHELRGPLAALRADLEISVRHPEQTDWSAMARDVLGDVESLQRLSDDLLLLARVDATPPRSRHAVDLARIVSQETNRSRRDGVDLSVRGGDVPVMIVGEHDLLRRLVRNLVHNAVGHAASRVEVAIERLPTSIRLIVADDGPGIPVHERQRVLERFVRLDEARTRDAGGTGLGLAIVRDVVARHAGQLSITDSKPHGATLTVTLPVDAPAGP